MWYEILVYQGTQMADAAVAILETCEEEESTLLIRRAEREGDSWSGHWSFPGGRRDAHDTDLVETALRELREECGIRLGRETLESALPHMLARSKLPLYLTVAPFVFRVDGQLPTVLDAREAAGAAWVRLGLLRDPNSHRLRAVPGRPANMLFPAVDLCGPPLWGFTYRLITSWLGLDAKGMPIERAGAEAAGVVLEFVLAEGLTLEGAWTVKGVIPVDRVLEHFSAPSSYLPGINCLEIRADQIRVMGLAWEEYWIRTV